MTNNDLRVVELFAGVGGFRVGLEQASPRFKTIWANQWEPGKSKKAQHAFNCYQKHFGASGSININEDIGTVEDDVPEHDLLCGGFPCQDYSVARTGARGIEGKKGVLWWSIRDILEKRHPKYVLLENVDRLLKSPAAQRGRDFGIILRCLHDAGYAAEWRVVNAADYGNAQRRRRTFIFACSRETPFYAGMAKQSNNSSSAYEWQEERLLKTGFFAKAFPVENRVKSSKRTLIDISARRFPELTDVSDRFEAMFFSSGILFKGKIYSAETIPVCIPAIPLRDVLSDDPVDESFFLGEDLTKWKTLKGAKRIPRIKPNGEHYFFTEGAIPFPDKLAAPARTMLTSEATTNRSTHVVEDKRTGKLRLLTPEECEKLNGFPVGWTNVEGAPMRSRYFTMGNALVVPLITEMGKRILEIAQE